MDVFQLPGILLRRWIYVVAPAILLVAMAAAYVVIVKPTVPVQTSILVDPQGLETEKGDLVPQISANNQDSSILESQLFVMQSSEILDTVVDKLNLTSDRFLFKGGLGNKDLARAATVAALQKHLTVEREGQSFILTLTFKHSDPVQGALIANTIASIYLDKVHESRSDASIRASGAFELQAQTLAARVRKAENELEAFKAENQLVSTGQQGLVIDQQVEGVNKQLIAARAELGAKQASYEQVRKLTVGSVQDGAIPEALASSALGTMRARYADLVAQANDLASALGANHPKMIAARSQVEGMRQVIEQELNRIRLSLKSGAERAQANVAALETRLQQLTRSSLDTSEAGIKARELQSEVDTLRALYKAFLSRSEELGQRDSVNINNSRIISRAVGVASSSMVAKLMILFAAGLFGIALGSGLAVLRELVGNFFESARVRASSSSPPQELAPETPEVAHGENISEIPHIPVIAHVPARRLKTPMRFSNARGGSLLDEPRRNVIPRGISMTADRLLTLAQAGQPAIVLLLSTGGEKVGDETASELAQALHGKGFDVIYSGGESGETHWSDVPLADKLRYERLSPLNSPRGDRIAPTFQNFANSRRNADFILIDGRGGAAQRYLGQLLETTDAILLLSREQEEKGALRSFFRTMEPWKDRMIGTILFEAAA